LDCVVLYQKQKKDPNTSNIKEYQSVQIFLQYAIYLNHTINKVD